MEELSIEQKAKAYDEAIEKARMWKEKSGMPADRQGILDDIFPELAESEDEKIRKEMLQIAKESEDSFYMVMTPNKRERLIAWLEKQGQDGKVWFYRDDYVRDKKQAYQDGIDNVLNNPQEYGLEKQGEQRSIKEHNICDTCDEKASCVIPCPVKLVEQKPIEWHREDEQSLNACLGYIPDEFLRRWLKDIIHAKYDKTAENVEPKFKVGDWITDGKFIVGQIISVGKEYYHYICNGIEQPLYIPNAHKYHLWTIQDAKDGDVLAVNNEVFIYAHRKQMYPIAVAHCFLDSAGGFHLDGEFGYMENGNLISLATKEQRDILLQKMKEAGYDWDSRTNKMIFNND